MEPKEVYLKLDKIAYDVSDLRVTSGKIAVILDRNTLDILNHIKRTDLLEDVVENLKDEIRQQQAKYRGALWAASLIFGVLAGLGQILARAFIH